jgi:hypothetical protein
MEAESCISNNYESSEEKEKIEKPSGINISIHNSVYRS